eukprot:1139829-Pelagomonas_calceolata.AAC.4
MHELSRFSGCPNHIIPDMKTEYHIIAGRMITKALSKSPWGAGLINLDIGSDDRLAQYNLHPLARASNRTLPPYLFPVVSLDSHQVVLMLSFLPPTMPYSLLPLLLPPAHTMCSAAGTAPT